jgi:hypothetical protein
LEFPVAAQRAGEKLDEVLAIGYAAAVQVQAKALLMLRGFATVPFTKGQSGNPAGKKPGTRNRATEMVEALVHEHAPDILRGVVERALAGDPISIKLCLEQILPRRRGRPIRLPGFLAEADADLVNTQLLITNQMLSGELSPEEALAFSEVVARRDSVDDEQVRHRLAELKKKIRVEINIQYVQPDGWVRSVDEWVDDDVS